MNLDLRCGDCLDWLPLLPEASVHLVLADPPYQTTTCSWDFIIPLVPLWQQLRRVLVPRGVIALFAAQPFTSLLVTSNLVMFKYTWVWRKSRPGAFVSAKRRPLKDTEDICVFSEGTMANGSDKNMPYYPQGVVAGQRTWKRPRRYPGNSGVNPYRQSHALERVIDGENYPRTVLEFANPNHNLFHPTEKPVDLLEYLVKTYTQQGQTVLDFCMGSGSTGVACQNTERNFIGMEKDPDYFQVASKRLSETPGQQTVQRLLFDGE